MHLHKCGCAWVQSVVWSVHACQCVWHKMTADHCDPLREMCLLCSGGGSAGSTVAPLMKASVTYNIISRSTSCRNHASDSLFSHVMSPELSLYLKVQLERRVSIVSVTVDLLLAAARLKNYQRKKQQLMLPVLTVYIHLDSSIKWGKVHWWTYNNFLWIYCIYSIRFCLILQLLHI